MYIYIKKNNNKCDHPIYTEVIYIIKIDNKKKTKKKLVPKWFIITNY